MTDYAHVALCVLVGVASTLTGIVVLVDAMRGM